MIYEYIIFWKRAGTGMTQTSPISIVIRSKIKIKKGIKGFSETKKDKNKNKINK